ncbi:MAG: aspartate aminotransferase family protein [Chloroflexi bacterium]|nr:aspartate aminotransferase family protein [Chloroflexota bacterium]
MAISSVATVPELAGPRIVTELPGPRAKELIKISEKYEPRSMSDQVPMVWARGERVWLEDVDGNVFLDFTSGVLVVNAGHSHPRLVAAMRDQADRVVNTYDFVNEWRPRLAQRLVEITPPNLDKAIVLTTGAETTEAAIKLARKFTGRHEIIAFHGAFHGRTYGAMSIGGKRSAAGTKGFGPFLPGVVFAPFPYCYRCPFGQTPDNCRLHGTDYLDWLVETETEDDVAAVIVETYQGGAGSIMAPEGWFPKLEAWCRKRDILLIIDEVQASFGRTGKLFGFEHYGITPNLLCLGKGISSSVPVSAIVGESRIVDTLTPGSLGSTHGGNAMSSRVALENIDVIIEERMSENAARVGEVMLARLQQLQNRFECLGDVRGMGLVFGLEMVTSKATREPDPDVTRRIVEAAYRRGLLLIAPIGFYGNVIRVAPPLVIAEEEALAGVELLAEAIAEAAG